ncbi:MAG: hypothetical protein JWM46_640, partial [Candidatus Kaiserbacteria bacterium]|nr:hypothetical protein [Candidatus Kaiserbacteria bacterium]
TTALGGICSPQFSCTNNVMYYQTTSCTTQVYQTCTNGCNGNSCANIATTPATSTLVTNPSTSTTHTSTTEELLNAFANPVSFTASNSATATPISVVLNSNTSDITGISAASASTSINPGTIASIQPLTSQQTFTSTDLSYTGPSTYSSPSTNGVMKLLSDLAAALTWAIHFLSPSSATK